MAALRSLAASTLAVAALAASSAGAQNSPSQVSSFIAGVRENKPMVGTIARVGAGFVFTPATDPTLAIPLQADQVVPGAAIGPTLSVVATPSPDRSSLAIQSLDLEALSNLKPKPLNASSDLAASLFALKSKAGEAFHVDAAPTQASTPDDADLHRQADETRSAELVEVFAQTEDQVISDYLVALEGNDSARRNQLVALFMKLRRDSKAIYGRPDYYDTVNYLKVYESSKSAVAIVEADTKSVKCSGVLVGADLVLTARHCLVDYLPTELEVWVGYEKGADGQVSYGTAFKGSSRPLIGLPVDPGGANFDYGILRVARSDDGKLASDLAKPACLSGVRLRRDQPIYVVGHPNGEPQTIHDNAWVLFPFAATPTEYGRLMLLVEAEFRNDPDRGKWVQQFRTDYRKSSALELYQYYSSRLGRQPIVAAEADTFHGDSGAPVFDRKRQSLVGLVVAGEPDVKEPWEPGFRRHESIVPASQIIEDVTKRDQALLAQLAVCSASLPVPPAQTAAMP